MREDSRSRYIRYPTCKAMKTKMVGALGMMIHSEGEDDVAPRKTARDQNKIVPRGIMRSVCCWPVGERVSNQKKMRP